MSQILLKNLFKILRILNKTSGPKLKSSKIKTPVKNLIVNGAVERGHIQLQYRIRLLI